MGLVPDLLRLEELREEIRIEAGFGIMIAQAFAALAEVTPAERLPGGLSKGTRALISMRRSRCTSLLKRRLSFATSLVTTEKSTMRP